MEADPQRIFDLSCHLRLYYNRINESTNWYKYKEDVRQILENVNIGIEGVACLLSKYNNTTTAGLKKYGMNSTNCFEKLNYDTYVNWGNYMIDRLKEYVGKVKKKLSSNESPLGTL